jgi:hypothetical protein
LNIQLDEYKNTIKKIESSADNEDEDKDLERISKLVRSVHDKNAEEVKNAEVKEDL